MAKSKNGFLSIQIPVETKEDEIELLNDLDISILEQHAKLSELSLRKYISMILHAHSLDVKKFLKKK